VGKRGCIVPRELVCGCGNGSPAVRRGSLMHFSKAVSVLYGESLVGAYTGLQERRRLHHVIGGIAERNVSALEGPRQAAKNRRGPPSGFGQP
jgi:hypothetical protein